MRALCCVLMLVDRVTGPHTDSAASPPTTGRQRPVAWSAAAQLVGAATSLDLLKGRKGKRPKQPQSSGTA